MVSCPSLTNNNAQDDWYRVVLTDSERVDFLLGGGSNTDLDLHLYHSDGTVITASTSGESSEEVTACLTAGTYYVKVNGFGQGANGYFFTYSTTAQTCDTTCVDDSNEDDDTFSQARDAIVLPYSSTNQEICPFDDDWYEVFLFTGQTMSIDLTFQQDNDAEDLDLHIYQHDQDLTPCGPSDVTDCTVAHGQGSASNEHEDFLTPSGCDDGCTYDVVVRGFDGASNSYGISISAQ